AEERNAGLAQLVVPALKNRGDRRAVEIVFGKAGDRERRERPGAHRVHVTHRVGRGNLAVDVRVVDDRGEEVNGLYERRSPLPLVHTRIVRGPEVDEDPVVSVEGNGAQHLSELARGEFARSTGAGDHLGQSFRHNRSLSPRVLVALRPAECWSRWAPV